MQTLRFVRKTGIHAEISVGFQGRINVIWRVFFQEVGTSIGQEFPAVRVAQRLLQLRIVKHEDLFLLIQVSHVS